MERRTLSNTLTSLRGAIGEAIAIGVGAIGAIDTAIGDHAIATGVRGIAIGVRVTIGARVACGGVRVTAIGAHAIIGRRAIVYGGVRASTGAPATGGDSTHRTIEIAKARSGGPFNLKRKGPGLCPFNARRNGDLLLGNLCHATDYCCTESLLNFEFDS